MGRAPAVYLLIFLVFSLLPAPASATQIPLNDFEGDLPATSLSGKGSSKTERFALVTGAVTANGLANGLFFSAGSQNARLLHVERVEVFDTSGNLNAIDVDEYRATQRPIHAAFHNATITIQNNASFAYYTNDLDHDINLSSDFAIGLPVVPPDDIGGKAFSLSVSTSLGLIGTTSYNLTMRPSGNDPNSILYLADANRTVAITSPTETNRSYGGQQYLFRIMGGAQLSGSAQTVLFPLASNVTATFRPGPDALAQDRIDPGLINDAFADVGANQTQSKQFELEKGATDLIRAAVPIFNGALLGNPRGQATIEGNDRTLGAFTFYRFETLTIEGAEDDEVHYQGSGRLVLAGNQFYTSKSYAGSPNFPIPLLSVFLWLMAAAAIVLGFALRPFFPANPANAAGPVRLTGLVVRIAGAIFAFLLWDFEIKSFLGTSILTLLADGGGGLALGMVASLELLGLSLAYFFFGLPVRFIVNSVLKLASMKKARGIGKGIGYLAAWGIGAAFLPLLLNPFVGLLVDRLGQGA